MIHARPSEWFVVVLFLGYSSFFIFIFLKKSAVQIYSQSLQWVVEFCFWNEVFELKLSSCRRILLIKHFRRILALSKQNPLWVGWLSQPHFPNVHQLRGMVIAILQYDR